jgi:gamma-glutamyltranspeptidase/glutathione hydrolase
MFNHVNLNYKISKIKQAKYFMKKILIIITYIFSVANAQLKEEIAPEPSTMLSAKPELIANDYMVVSGHPLASKIGKKIIAKGGNAIDAAIAVQMVLNVVEPHASGIGGGGFLLYHDAKTKISKYYNGRETAPKNINLDIFLNKDGAKKDFYQALKGGAPVGVPGILKMLFTAHQEHGSLPWFELFIDAIDIATFGYEVSPRLYKLINQTNHIQDFPNSKRSFQLENEDADFAGENQVSKLENNIVTLYNLELANSFRNIAKNGIKYFYEGKLANQIVDKVQNSQINPGSLVLQDLANYKIKMGSLVCLNYHKHKVCTMPMPSGGVTLLQALGILENFDLAQMEPMSLEAVHIMSEANRLAFTDRGKFSADESFIQVPVAKLLDKSYLKERSFLINIDAALMQVKAGEFSSLLTSKKYAFHKKQYESTSTTHMSIIDKAGNAVSFTSSIEYSFGSGLMVGGFLLNNQLTDFSFIAKKNGKLIANRIEPNKQPRSSMSPVFIFDKKDNIKYIIGSPGGARIIPYMLKTIIAVLDWDVNLNQAIALPNFNKMFDKLEIEIDSELVDYKADLEAIGHQVLIRDLTSGIHAIEIKDGQMFSGVDPRRDGQAAGR